MATVKSKDIAKEYGIDVEVLDRFLREKKNFYNINFGIMNNAVDESDVPKIIDDFKKQQIQEKEEYIRRKAEEQANIQERTRKIQEKQKALASMLVTSGFNFDGYTITRYSGYISGDDATQINRGDLYKNNGQVLSDALVKIRIQALKELKEAAYDLGCNAIIGVDFDYLTFEPETATIGGGTLYQPYVVCVTANGNAVIIEKNSTGEEA